MAQTQDATIPHLSGWWRWEVACRDDTRVVRRLSPKQVIEGGYRLDEGALLEDRFHILPAVGVMALLAHACGTAIVSRPPSSPGTWAISPSKARAA